MLLTEYLLKVKARIEQKQSFVLNIIAAWCPDCTKSQAPNLQKFANDYLPSKLDVINLQVQIERRVYLSDEYRNFVASLGGHGFPRTVLYKNGNAVDWNNVEVISDEALRDLANKFESLISM